MVKTWPETQDHRTPMVRISDPAMEWHEIDLNDLLGCCRRELARRQFVFPKRVAEGTMNDKKAEAEIEQMRVVVDFLVHCVFKAVTRRAPPLSKEPSYDQA
jgi:hypothetical protein